MEALGDEMVTAFQVFREVQEFGVIAQFFENINRFERLRLFAAQKGLDLRCDDEEAVKLELEIRKVAEHDVFVFDRHWKVDQYVSVRRYTDSARYFESKSFVRRMINFITRPPSSLSFASLAALTASLAVESRPRMMACSKFFLKSFLEPRKLGLAKFRREKYSDRSF